MTDLLVFDSPFEPGWNGDPKDVPASSPLIQAEEAWEAEWPTDAHCVQYFIPGEEAMPRLNKSSIAWLQTHHDIQPQVAWVMVDVDNPHHQEWDDRLLEHLAATLDPANLPEADSAGYYQTQHGYRLVWRLAEPMPALLFEDWATMFYEYLRSRGVEADMACRDWTRLFRMPKATRDGVLQDHPLDFSNIYSGLTLDWTPPRAPVEGQAPGRKSVQTWDTDMERPEVPSRTLARDAQYLKDTPWYQPIMDRRALAHDGERNAKTISALGTVLNRMQPDPDPYLAFKLLSPCVQAQVEEGSRWDLDWLWVKCLLFANREQGQREYRDDLKAATIGVRHLLQMKEAERMGLGGSPEEADDPDFVRKLILTPPGLNVVYLWDINRGRYERKAFHPMTLARDLSRACGHGSLEDEDGIPLVDLRDDKGKLLPGSEIMHRYSSEVSRTVYRYVPGTSYDDATSTLTTSLTDINPYLRPEYNAEIDRWLDLLGGEEAWRIKDWLSVMFQYDYPVCALYLEGGSGLGKGMLGEGLSQIWSGAYCDFSEITKSFNQRLLVTPLVWADEVAEGDVGKSMSAAFRKIVGSSVHDISVKYQSNLELHGCPRVLITANNPNAIRFMETMSGDDIDAVVTRFGHVMCSVEAADYLRSLGGRRATLDWVQGLGIANHVAWMNENYVMPDEMGRYLVPGWARDFAENLVAHGSMQGEVQDAIVRYLTHHAIKKPITGLMTWHEGALGVNTAMLQDSWGLLMGDKAKVPSRSQVNKVAKSLCDGDCRKRMPSGQSLRYRLMKMDSLVRYAEQVLDIDPEELYKAFKVIEDQEVK